ncbi:tetratricopeptide repeat protein [Lentzea sp. NPDC060358]|uniref:tetratricopeptide repeat protein n=1 Tax=Lentzea sp. NPDC060358 TaxID=3347103 RepID=UPI0036568951
MNVLAHARDLDRARAADLARAGQHEAARRILEGLGRDPSTLDLLARVHAQRGDLAAAGAAWDEVLSQDPAHASALAGTRLIAGIAAGRRRARPVPVELLGGSLAVVAIALGAVLVLPHDEPSPAASPPAPVVTSTPPPPPVVPALLAPLASPDVRVSAAGAGVHVVFLQGMFPPDGTSLSRSGREQLERWGRLLRGRAVRVTVVGHGVAVPGTPSTGGSTTAIARAAAAVEVLAAVGEQPPAAFVLRSAEQSDLPHAGGEAALNRTVTLQVHPR